MTVTTLRARLETAREQLLAALANLSEQHFAAPIEGGTSVAGALVQLAQAERAAVQAGRAAAGAPPRPGGSARGLAEADVAKLVPPQLIHELAGARYELLLLLDALDDDALRRDAGDASIEALLLAVADREQSTAERIASRPAADGG